MAKRVLVCEDDEGISEMMQMMLEGSGYEVQVCLEGELIQETVQNYRPDLILLDLALPGMDGRQAAKQLKEQRKTSRIPIILVSARRELESIAKGSGADGYLAKPFKMADLLAIVAKF
jgi:DNA-binding response OmpR family regulator